MTDGAMEATLLGMDPRKGRWVLVALGLIINLCLGSIYSWSVFVEPLTEFFTETLGRAVTASEVLLPFSVFLVGFFAIFNGGGRPGFGWLTDRLNPRNTAMLTFVLIGFASLAMWLAPTVPVYVLAFAILWGCLGGWLAIAPTTTASFFGTCDYPRCYGVVFLAYGAGAIVGPQLAGSINASTGGYLGVFPYVAVLAVAGFVIAYLLMRPPAAAEG